MSDAVHSCEGNRSYALRREGKPDFRGIAIWKEVIKRIVMCAIRLVSQRQRGGPEARPVQVIAPPAQASHQLRHDLALGEVLRAAGRVGDGRRLGVEAEVVVERREDQIGRAHV